ncbi:MAG TPA: hypothetical protein PKY77_23575 [Phycisphaerae bacterium]|nr:hypothetical protein [Phycisphaerae bacterium]HRY66466.1 hypothetical protein [Phycisphaerae bacterium]HSA25826.1 hypothetical protein [Phycisphaerae bacterium]
MLAVAVVSALGGTSSHAQGILDTFGQGSAFDVTHTYLIVDRPAFGYQAVAMRFQSGVDQQFTRAVVATSAWPYTDGYTGSMIAMLIEGDEDAPSNSILEQFSFGSPYGPTVITFTSASRPSLTAGGIYWFAILPDASAWPWQTYGGWHLSSEVVTAPSNLAVKQSRSGPWAAMGTPEGTPEEAPALRVEAIVVVAADADADGDVDRQDFERFSVCASGPAMPHGGGPECRQTDFDGDGDVDQSDFGILQRCWSGANRSPDPNCAK